MSLPKATAVILTALDNEYQEVMRHLESIGEITHPAGTIYRVGSFIGINARWAVVVAKNGKRNLKTAILTERVISFFKPDVLIFVGCAGAWKDCQFGDVVAVARVSGVEAGADTNKGFEGADEGRTIPYKIAEILNYLNGWQERTIVDEKYHEIKNSGKLIVETITSVEKTQKTYRSKAVQQMKRASRDSVAVDTESIGFLTAAEMNAHKCAFVVRGISDKFIDKDNIQDIVQQPIATALAAAVAYEFISQRNPKISLISTLIEDTPGTTELFRLLSKNFEVPNAPKKKVDDAHIKMDFGPFADAGFFAEVIAEKTLGREPDAVDPKGLCEIATLCQKAGYLDTAWHFLFEALGRKSPYPLSVAIKAHSYWVALRLLSQSGNVSGVIQNFKKVIKWLSANNELEKMAPIYSRAGVAYAILGNHRESKRCFQTAANFAMNGNEHQRVTVKVLWALAHHFRDIDFDGDPLQTVVDAQIYYLTNKVDAHLAQAYPLKSTLQCLFAEAAIMLTGDNPSQGLLRLAAASIVRRRAFSHPDSEGFAELLFLVRNSDHRKLIRCAMEPSFHAFGSQEFQPFLTKCSKLLPLFSFGSVEWEKMRQLFSIEETSI